MIGYSLLVVTFAAIHSADAIERGGVQTVVFQYLLVARQRLGVVASHTIGVCKGSVEAYIARIAAQTLFQQFDSHLLTVAHTVQRTQIVVGIRQSAVQLYRLLEMPHRLCVVAFAILYVSHHILPTGKLRVAPQGAVCPRNGVDMLVALRLHVCHHRLRQCRSSVHLDGSLRTMARAVEVVQLQQTVGLMRQRLRGVVLI